MKKTQTPTILWPIVDCYKHFKYKNVFELSKPLFGIKICIMDYQPLCSSGRGLALPTLWYTVTTYYVALYCGEKHIPCNSVVVIEAQRENSVGNNCSTIFPTPVDAIGRLLATRSCSWINNAIILNGSCCF